MPYLIDPADAALAIGAKCAGTVTSDNAALLDIIELLLPKVEDAMGVASLTYGRTTDTFTLADPYVGDTRRPARFLLANGYVENSVENPVVVTDPSGAAVTSFTLDTKLGVLTLPDTWIMGVYTVSYHAGFKVQVANPDALPPTVELFLNVPLWIKGLMVTLLTFWYRTTSKVLTLPQNTRYGELMVPLFREVTNRVTTRYHRPHDATFPDTSVRDDGLLV